MWRQSEQFRRVDYRRVELNWRLLTLPREWPDDIRWVVEEFRKTEDGRGIKQRYSPRFFIAADRKLIVTDTGQRGWDATIVPKLRTMVGA